MSEALWIILFSVLVVVLLYVLKRFVIQVRSLPALFLAVVMCAIFAAVEIYVVGSKFDVFNFVGVGLLIYAVSNLIYQVISKARA